MTQAALLQRSTKNLLLNPRANTGGTTNWNLTAAGTWTQDTTVTRDTVPSLRITVAGTGSLMINSRSASTALAGKRTTIQARVRASTSGQSVRIRCRYEGGVSTDHYSQYVEPTTAVDDWTWITLTSPAAPTGTTYVRFYFEVDNTLTTVGDQFWLVQPQVEIGDRPTRYTDNVIGASDFTRAPSTVTIPHPDDVAVLSVDYSLDEGATWQMATLPDGEGRIGRGAEIVRDGTDLTVRTAGTVALRNLRTDERELRSLERRMWRDSAPGDWFGVARAYDDDPAHLAAIDAEILADDTWDASRTLSLVGDLHAFYTLYPEAEAAAQSRIDQTFADLATLSGTYARRIYLGDLLEMPEPTGATPTSHDTTMLGWMNALESNWLAVPGNHDLRSDGGRTAADWATVYGMAAKVSYATADRGIWRIDLGFCNVIGLTPRVRDVSPQGTLDAADIAQLDTWLGIYRKDTVIVCHYPLWGSVRPHPEDKGFNTFGTPIADNTQVVQPHADVLAVLDKHPHARVWVGAHVHPPATAPRLATNYWTGSRYIATVNAGAPVYTNGDAATGPLADDPPRSYFLTIHPDRVEIRQRNHRDGVWEMRRSEPAPAHERGQPAQVLWWGEPEEVAPEGTNPTTALLTFANPATAVDADGTPFPLSLPGDSTYETTAGLEGLNTGTGYASFDPRPYLDTEEGTVVVRARFTAAPDGSTRYIFYLPTSPNGSRIYLDRDATGYISARLASGFRTASANPITDTDIHTFAISWRKWQVTLYVDGVLQGKGHTVSRPYEQLTEIGAMARFSMTGAPSIVVYDALLARRELTDAEHARLHATAGHWTRTTLDVPTMGA